MEHANNWRRKKGKKKLRKTLKPTAIPTQWPKCPKHLSKSLPSPRSTTKCRQRSSRIDKQKKTNVKVKPPATVKLIHSLEDLDKKFRVTSKNYHITKGEDFRLIFSLDEEKPVIQYCIKVFSGLNFQLWCNGSIVNSRDIGLEEVETVCSCSQINRMLMLLSEKYSEHARQLQSDNYVMTGIVKELESRFGGNSKVQFLAEQLSLVFVKPQARRYSPDLLGMTCMWEMCSPALYKQICSSDVLTFPHYKYLRSLTSAIGSDLKLTEPAIRYLKARFSKLKNIETLVSLIMDEVFVRKMIELSNGRIYGLTNNEVTKTLLCIMIKSICGKYRDVVAMVPIKNINHSIIHTVWKENLK